RRRFNWLDVDAHLTAANETGLLCEVVVELIVDELRSSIEDRLARLAKGVVLIAPAADGSDQPSVPKHEHLRADALRRRTGRGHDSHQRRGLSAFERFGDGGEDLLVHL